MSKLIMACSKCGRYHKVDAIVSNNIAKLLHSPLKNMKGRNE